MLYAYTMCGSMCSAPTCLRVLVWDSGKNVYISQMCRFIGLLQAFIQETVLSCQCHFAALPCTLLLQKIYYYIVHSGLNLALPLSCLLIPLVLSCE